MKTMRERFDELMNVLFDKHGEGYEIYAPDKFTQDILDFIEQELKKEREEIQECVMTILDIATPFDSPQDTIDCIKVDIKNYFDKLKTEHEKQ